MKQMRTNNPNEQKDRQKEQKQPKEGTETNKQIETRREREREKKKRDRKKDITEHCVPQIAFQFSFRTAFSQVSHIRAKKRITKHVW